MFETIAHAQTFVKHPDKHETFQFTSFVKATVFAIDADGKETRIIGFTLFPKISGSERMNEIVGAISPEPTWRNFKVYPDGSLRDMDSIQ